MTDLVTSLRGKCKLLHQCVEMRRKAADEIERLRNQLSFMTKECKRFEAVVDAAKRSREVDEYGLLSVEKGWELDRALAALEDDDD